MNTGAIFWLVIFGCSVFLFFGIAAVISVLGFRDLRLLLTKSPPKDDAP